MEAGEMAHFDAGYPKLATTLGCYKCCKENQQKTVLRKACSLIFSPVFPASVYLRLFMFVYSFPCRLVTQPGTQDAYWRQSITRTSTRTRGVP